MGVLKNNDCNQPENLEEIIPDFIRVIDQAGFKNASWRIEWNSVAKSAVATAINTHF